MDASFEALYDVGTGEGDETGGSGNTFANNYGWIYSTEQVAELERITLDEAYELPILQFLNDLVYLKAKSDNEQKMIEKLKR